MALITEMVEVNKLPKVKTKVSSDYSYTDTVFQIRTYKNGDLTRSETPKQNIQFDKIMAQELINKLVKFLNQQKT